MVCDARAYSRGTFGCTKRWTPHSRLPPSTSCASTRGGMWSMRCSPSTKILGHRCVLCVQRVRRTRSCTYASPARSPFVLQNGYPYAMIVNGGQQVRPTANIFQDAVSSGSFGPGGGGVGVGQLSDINKVVSGLTTAALRASTGNLATAVVGALRPMPYMCVRAAARAHTRYMLCRTLSVAPFAATLLWDGIGTLS